MSTQQTKRLDVHQQVTDQIIAAIEAGAGKVVMPWHRSGSNTRPVNIASGNAYRGINVLALWAAAENRGFGSGTWGTYRQWLAKNCQVRKGEKASLVVFYKEFDVAEQNADTGEEDHSTRLFARASFVFNSAQVDGYEPPAVVTPANPAETLDAVERFVTSTGAAIQHGGESAYYHRGTDHIQMPQKNIFIGTDTMSATESYYAVLLHELTHWTGAKNRLDRTMGKRFGDDGYAMEELVAELGAAFLCADLSITASARPDHAAYIDNWLRVLKSDKRAIFTAAAKASQAADYLSNLQPEAIEAAA